MLLEVEAKKRRIDTHRLYELEVSSRVPAATPAQIKKFLEENRQEFEGMDPAAANQQVAAYLHDEAENKLADDLVNRLRKIEPGRHGRRYKLAQSESRGSGRNNRRPATESRISNRKTKTNHLPDEARSLRTD